MNPTVFPLAAPGVSKRKSLFVAARDGLRLHYCDYTAPAGRAPVVCLPGLARSAADFDPLAEALAANGRRVVALDYRGRGESDWDQDWTHYDLDAEEGDILAVLAHAGIESAIFIGTSRGGIHVMRLAKARPGLLRAAVLNDIGPVVEVAGLVRIKRYVGKLPPLANMSDAVALMRLTAGALFSNVSMQEWEIYARQTFVERDGQVVLRYDPALSHTLDTVGPNMEVPNFWPEFEALMSVPTMAIRGANSDILSPDVFSEMARRHPNFQSLTVEGQGHAPLLLDRPTIDAIVEFIGRCP
jgi:pimeloyl-ACP methyl ester carboxylesterase